MHPARELPSEVARIAQKFAERLMIQWREVNGMDKCFSIAGSTDGRVIGVRVISLRRGLTEA